MIAKLANIFPHHIIAPYGIWPELSNKAVITIRVFIDASHNDWTINLTIIVLCVSTITQGSPFLKKTSPCTSLTDCC